MPKYNSTGLPYLPVLVLLGLLLFLVNLDALFVNIMEARNFIAAREMLTHGNWIFTTMNELPRYEKPPLPTWLTAISAGLFGLENLFAYRLPAALTSIFLVVIFYKLQLSLNIKKSFAFGASVILMTSFYILFSGRDGQWDIFTHSFMVACCYFFVLMLTSEKKNILYAAIAGLFFGASLMSKGPVSLYALFLPFLISYGVIYKFKQPGKNWKLYLIFILTGIISGSWWTVYVHYYDPAAFAEIATQESSRWFNYNVRPIWYYWSFFTQSGIWTIPALLGLFYWYLKGKVSNLKAYRFYLLWTLISLVLLSIIPEKKSRYLLPVLIPLAVTTAFYVEVVIKNFKHNFSKTERFPVYLNFILLTLIAFAAPAILYYTLGAVVLEKSFIYVGFSIVMITLGTLFIFGMIKSRIRLLFSLQATMIFLIILLGFPLTKLIDPDRNTPNISDLKEIQAEENIELYDATGMLPELIWEYGKPIPLIVDQQDIPVADEKFGVLIAPDDKSKKEAFKKYILEFRGTLDLNPTISKGSNSRLMRDFYIARRK
ncbi:MAG: glycosyltransferase family 39 protein [Gillisia sp.]